ncbi:MAG TPA: undecaprenyl-diphosphate phosphatase [Opitutaceae bacterium]|nr:undecaprenyl-diphosphate phosphatase [Opitutaceae bacterium]
MRFRSLLSILFASFLFLDAFAQSVPTASPEKETPVPSPAAQPAAAGGPIAELSTRDSAVLGLVEGITEFLPISSTGHLIIANHALGLESETPLKDAADNPLWYKKPSAKHPAGIPLTIKLAADTYIVVIQVGAIAAVVFIYWRQLVGILGGLAGRNAAGLRLLRNLCLAFIPVSIIGYALKDWIDDHLFSLQAVIVALISGAVLMFCAERYRKDQLPQNSRTEPSDLTVKQSLGIGIMQCLALWPGMSRSMVTMVGGYFCGLSPAKAAEFSFLVGLPTLAGAALLKGLTGGPAMIQVFGLSHVLFGGIVAAISAGLAVKFLVLYLSRHGLGVFAVYRVLLAALLAAWFFL